MIEMPFAEQMERNIDARRLDKKIRFLEMQARERRKKRMPKKVKDFISKRTQELLKTYGLDKE